MPKKPKVSRAKRARSAYKHSGLAPVVTKEVVGSPVPPTPSRPATTVIRGQSSRIKSITIQKNWEERYSLIKQSFKLALILGAGCLILLVIIAFLIR